MIFTLSTTTNNAQTTVITIYNVLGTCDMWIHGYANSSCVATPYLSSGVCVPAGTTAVLNSIGSAGDEWEYFSFQPAPASAGCGNPNNCGHAPDYIFNLYYQSMGCGTPTTFVGGSCPCGSSITITQPSATTIEIL